MGFKEFELTKVETQETKTYELPSSAPAPIVQKASEIMHGDTEGRMEGDKVKGSMKTVNLEKASHHIVKETLSMNSFPRNNALKWDELDGESLDKLKNHYLKTDLTSKNSNGSGGEQSSSEKQ